MKKKLILGALTVITGMFVFNEAKASTESHDGDCKAPYTNTCVVVHLPFGATKTIKGVLTINM